MGSLSLTLILRSTNCLKHLKLGYPRQSTSWQRVQYPKSTKIDVAFPMPCVLSIFYPNKIQPPQHTLDLQRNLRFSGPIIPAVSMACHSASTECTRRCMSLLGSGHRKGCSLSGDSVGSSRGFKAAWESSPITQRVGSHLVCTFYFFREHDSSWQDDKKDRK